MATAPSSLWLSRSDLRMSSTCRKCMWYFSQMANESYQEAKETRVDPCLCTPSPQRTILNRLHMPGIATQDGLTFMESWSHRARKASSLSVTPTSFCALLSSWWWRDSLICLQIDYIFLSLPTTCSVLVFSLKCCSNCACRSPGH